MSPCHPTGPDGLCCSVPSQALACRVLAVCLLACVPHLLQFSVKRVVPSVTWVPSRVHGTQLVLNKSHPCWIALRIKEHTALSESGVEVRWQWESSLKVQVTPTEKGLVLPWVILSRGLGGCPSRLEKHSTPGTSGGSRQDAEHQFTDCGFQRFGNHQSPQ